MENKKRYLVTGGTGFLGGELIKRLNKSNNLIRVMSRNEGKLISLKEKYPSIEIYPGDICNPFHVQQAMQDVDAVFHLAAFKHVGMAEKHSVECFESNVVGTLNLLKESLKTEPDFFISISTDKAAQVVGVYGATKLLMEKIQLQFEAMNKKTSYRIVRYGNVLYSTGSVLCKWRDLLKNNKEITVTDPNATRFFWSVDEAVDLIFDCLKNAKNSKPYIPEMKSMSIGNLLEAMSIKYLPKGAELQINTIGLQPGENLHEKMLKDGPDSSEVDRFTIEEIMDKI